MVAVEDPLEHLFLKKMGVEVEEVAEGLTKFPLLPLFSWIQVMTVVAEAVLAGEEPLQMMLSSQCLFSLRLLLALEMV
jgi:hypothetical protein